MIRADSNPYTQIWKARATRDWPSCCCLPAGTECEVAVSLAHLGPLYASIPIPRLDEAGTARVWSMADLRPAERPVTLAAAATRAGAPLLIVTARQESADTIHSALSTLLPTAAQPYVWSAADPLPYEQLPHDPALSASR